MPSEAETAEAKVRPFRDMTPDQRLRVQAALVRALLAFAGDRPILRGDDNEVDPFWRRWKDPMIGAPRG